VPSAGPTAASSGPRSRVARRVLAEMGGVVPILDFEPARLADPFVDFGVVLFVDFFFSEDFFVSGVFLAGLFLELPRAVADWVATLVFFALGVVFGMVRSYTF
jgi:hypothetical protein